MIALDDPREDDVRALLERHLSLMHSQSAPEDVHALDVTGLLSPLVSFFSARTADGTLVGVGALKRIDADHAELKSMHTAAGARRQGVGRSMLAHLLDLARSRGYRRVSLETGVQEAFAPGRAMYTAAGFTECGAFEGYEPSDASTFMTLLL